MKSRYPRLHQVGLGKAGVFRFLEVIGPGLGALALLLSGVCRPAQANEPIVPDGIMLSDDFEGDLSRWEVPAPSLARRVEGGDPGHRTLLEIVPNDTAQCVLARYSASWAKYRVEGEVLFPGDGDSYFGFVYDYRQEAPRTDFGCIYVKGNGSYVAVNPHRDGNASRALYEEYKVALPPDRRIEIGRWYPFKAEVIGSTCHFYFQDLQTPCITFGDWEYSSGKTGFKPRLRGSACWVDNIRIRPITEFAYQGAPRPEHPTYCSQRLLTQWKVLGPFDRRIPEIEAATDAAACDIVDHGSHRRFSDFSTDRRGCLVTGRICRHSTDESVAYFLTSHTSTIATEAWLEVSATDEVGVWVNSVFMGNVPKQNSAWYDFDTNPQHPGSALRIALRSGSNAILFCVEGGNYGGDGLFARITPHNNNRDPDPGNARSERSGATD